MSKAFKKYKKIKPSKRVSSFFKRQTREDVTSVPCPKIERVPSKAIILRSAYDLLSKFILDYPNIETGGQLFGHWTADGTPIVLFAIGPGENSNHQATFFNQDIPYLQEVGTLLVKRFNLQHIGEWHSHHQLGLAVPSGHDARTMATSIEERHLSKFLLCIANVRNGKSTINPYLFIEGYRTQYIKLQWDIREDNFPWLQVIEGDLNHILTKPKTREAAYENLVHKQETLALDKGYWFNKKENRILLKTFIDLIENESKGSKCSVELDRNGLIHIKVVRGNIQEDILFGKDFPEREPEVSLLHNKENYKLKGKWSNSGSTYNDFKEFYKSLSYDG